MGKQVCDTSWLHLFIIHLLLYVGIHYCSKEKFTYSMNIYTGPSLCPTTYPEVVEMNRADSVLALYRCSLTSRQTIENTSNVKCIDSLVYQTLYLSNTAPCRGLIVGCRCLIIGCRDIFVGCRDHSGGKDHIVGCRGLLVGCRDILVGCRWLLVGYGDVLVWYGLLMPSIVRE